MMQNAGFDAKRRFCRSGKETGLRHLEIPLPAAMNSIHLPQERYDYHETLIGFVAEAKAPPF